MKNTEGKPEMMNYTLRIPRALRNKLVENARDVDLPARTFAVLLLSLGLEKKLTLEEISPGEPKE